MRILNTIMLSGVLGTAVLMYMNRNTPSVNPLCYFCYICGGCVAFFYIMMAIDWLDRKFQ